MAWSLIRHPQGVRATAKLAKGFAEMQACESERPYKPPIAAMIRDALLTSQFRTAVWAKAHCREDGSVRRVNGKHSSTEIDKLYEAGKLTVAPVVTVEEYTCDTLADVADLYATFDPGRSSRSANDINAIYHAAAPKLADVARGSFNLAVAAVAYATWEDQYTKHIARDQALLALEFPGFILWLHDLVHGRQAKFLLPGTVAAAMFHCWRKSQQAATEFWQAVRDGTDPAPTSPSRRLQKYLLTGSNIGRVSGGVKVLASQREMYVKSLHAWNAYRRGGATDLKYYRNAKVPKTA
jgi:hypothetical protein